MEMSTLEALLSAPVAKVAPVATPMVVNAAPVATPAGASPAWRNDEVSAAQRTFIGVLRTKCQQFGFDELAAQKCLPRKGPASDYIGAMIAALDSVVTPAQKAQPAQKSARKPRKPRRKSA